MLTAQDILRKVVALNKRRAGEGLDPLEYQRWLDLSSKLRQEFPCHPPLGGRKETHIRIEFSDYDALLDATMFNIQPIGIYINTPFAADVGAKFGLNVFIKESQSSYRGGVEVVSNNIGPDFSTANLGMGMRFTERASELRSVLEKISGTTGAPAD
jgi:hypothetical protein